MTRPLTIRDAAAAAGLSAKMIRHYEQIGLIAPAARTEAGYRLYSAQDVAVLRFIRQSRLLGFPIEQVAELIGLWTQPGRASREVKALAEAHLQGIEQKLQELQAMQAQLRQLVSACHGDEHPDCAILQRLASQRAAPPAAAAPALKPRRPARVAAAPAPAPDTAAELMSWTRQILHPAAR